MISPVLAEFAPFQRDLYSARCQRHVGFYLVAYLSGARKRLTKKPHARWFHRLRNVILLIFWKID
jgi:hypothetical protein